MHTKKPHCLRSGREKPTVIIRWLQSTNTLNHWEECRPSRDLVCGDAGTHKKKLKRASILKIPSAHVRCDTATPTAGRRYCIAHARFVTLLQKNTDRQAWRWQYVLWRLFSECLKNKWTGAVGLKNNKNASKHHSSLASYENSFTRVAQIWKRTEEFSLQLRATEISAVLREPKKC